MIWATRHILVNIPAYELRGSRGESVPLKMKVVVGTNENRTPLFSDMMESVVFSPYWNIPESIATKEMLPKIMKDPDYLMRQNIEVVKIGKTTEIINPSEINWNEAPGDFQYQLRQKPGRNSNSLGLVKFLFPNEFNVYLHDTPADNLFDQVHSEFQSRMCSRRAAGGTGRISPQGSARMDGGKNRNRDACGNRKACCLEESRSRSHRLLDCLGRFDRGASDPPGRLRIWLSCQSGPLWKIEGNHCSLPPRCVCVWVLIAVRPVDPKHSSPPGVPPCQRSDL